MSAKNTKAKTNFQAMDIPQIIGVEQPYIYKCILFADCFTDISQFWFV